jgi:hypothetical protein
VIASAPVAATSEVLEMNQNATIAPANENAKPAGRVM